MVTIEITYRGDLHCEARHRPSGQLVQAAFPPADRAGSDAFSPTDLLAAAFGTCLAIELGRIAEKELLNLAGMRVSVTKEMVDAPVRRIGRLCALIEIPVPLTSGMKASLERAAHRCPVRASLCAEIETGVHFVFA
ncbi:MAG: OsmC family peroxiredoxin [Acidobacteria bacterium]|nr:MAG: OsmC family peroxiredoxin [Acidobacteriota bacterium]